MSKRHRDIIDLLSKIKVAEPEDIPKDAIVTTLRSHDEDGTRRESYVPADEVPCFKCGELCWLSRSSPRGLKVYCLECTTAVIKGEKDGG